MTDSNGPQINFTEYTATREYTADELIPAETLAEFGEADMQRELASYLRCMDNGKKYSNTGWVVTVSYTHAGVTNGDAAEIKKMLESALDELPALTMAAFE